MTITLDELRKKYEELGEMIKSFEEQLKEAEFPKKGDTYYRIDGYGKIRQDRFIDGITNTHHIPIGNCFRTKEEAEFAVEQRKVIAEMKRCGGVWKTKTAEANEYCLYGAMLNTVVGIAVSNTEDCLPNIWFPTKEAAQKAIDTIGEERLLKYWFCVEV